MQGEARDAAQNAAMEGAVFRKTFWRIIPFCFVLYVISYVDRANIGYAALQMNKELALSSEAFGFAAGVFFLGYFLFEVPSNMMLARFGARVWIARILLTWGAVSVLSAFVHSATQLYVLRFLLGVAEAGFFPGIIIYLTAWFRAKDQAATIAWFTAAIPVSYLIGAPLSTWVMDHMHGLGLSGWRWMLLLEGVPAILGGVATFILLTDRPDQARWLTEAERAWLTSALAQDQAAVRGAKHLGTLKAVTDWKVLYLSMIYFIYQCGSLGVGYWLPQIIRELSHGFSAAQIGWIATIPYAVASVTMILWSMHSDRTRERRLHSALPLLVGGAALALAGFTRNPTLALGLISVSLAGLYAFKAPFWALPGLFLTRSTAAISIAAINSIGNLGGFAGPYLIGWMKQTSGDAMTGLLVLAALVLVAAVMTFLARLSNAAGPSSPAHPAASREAA
ncbi:MAG TPA: MFS transporter [Caulobacteraceae bacterium]|jgi:ACS family tartrate transporter-like MFS transporter